MSLEARLRWLPSADITRADQSPTTLDIATPSAGLAPLVSDRLVTSGLVARVSPVEHDMVNEQPATDDDLVRDTVRGDATAFDRLVERHASAGLRYATRMLGSHEDAQEVTQDAWVRAFRALPRFDFSTAFRTWWFAILVNRCRTALAGRARRERLVFNDGSAVAAARSTDESDRVALRVELQRAVARLPHDLREAFLLKHVEQLEYTEMVAIVGAGVSALKMRVQRACQQLREELREYDDER